MIAGKLTEAVLIRPVQREDFAGWLRLWANYNAYGQSGPTAVPNELTEATWGRLLQSDQPMEALVAELDGSLVGFAHLVFHPSTSVVRPVCFLNDLFVEVARHGRGIGRALIQAVYTRAEAAGAQRVYWHVLDTNVNAVHLYDGVARRSGHVVYRMDI